MADTAELASRFRTPAAAERFAAAYAELAGRWPQPVTQLDVGGPSGTTHVRAGGPPGGPPLVLLHGGGCTAAAWFATARALGRQYRVYGIDQIGDAGLSVAAGRPARRPADLLDWLDGVLGQLGLESAAMCGHSYGSWLALSYALRRPGQVTRLALLDPTSCFGGLSAGYRLRAMPVLARPSERRARALVGWETGHRTELEPAARSLHALSGEFRAAKIVLPRRPAAADLRAATFPALILLAGRSRAHDIRRVGARARELMPSARVTVLPGASHHSLPATDPDPLNQELAGFLQ
jgi:pimeloyl-ACP methyl ester carboxylesterase